MALEPKTKKIILISVGILALVGLGILIYFLAKPSDTTPVVPPGSTTTSKPGILDTVTKQFCNLFPKSKICGGAGNAVNCVSGCDSARPGYNCDGFPDTNCDFG